MEYFSGGPLNRRQRGKQRLFVATVQLDVVAGLRARIESNCVRGD
jgi:hypothetical protein